MPECFERTRQINFTNDEIHILKNILRDEFHNAIRRENWFAKGQIEAIFDRFAEAENREQTTPTPIDMATVNNAFTRIREALADVGQAINSKTTICLEEVNHE